MLVIIGLSLNSQVQKISLILNSVLRSRSVFGRLRALAPGGAEAVRAAPATANQLITFRVIISLLKPFPISLRDSHGRMKRLTNQDVWVGAKNCVLQNHYIF